MRKAGYIMKGFRRVGYLNESLHSGTYFVILKDSIYEFDTMCDLDKWLSENHMRMK